MLVKILKGKLKQNSEKLFLLFFVFTIFYTNSLKAAYSNFEKQKIYAGRLFTSFQYKKAIVLYNGILSSEPSDIASLINRGRCYMKLKKYQHAYRDFNSALTLEPQNKLAAKYLHFVKKKRQFISFPEQNHSAGISKQKASFRVSKNEEKIILEKPISRPDKKERTSILLAKERERMENELFEPAEKRRVEKEIRVALEEPLKAPSENGELQLSGRSLLQERKAYLLELERQRAQKETKLQNRIEGLERSLAAAKEEERQAYQLEQQKSDRERALEKKILKLEQQLAMSAKSEQRESIAQPKTSVQAFQEEKWAQEGALKRRRELEDMLLNFEDKRRKKVTDKQVKPSEPQAPRKDEKIDLAEIDEKKKMEKLLFEVENAIGPTSGQEDILKPLPEQTVKKEPEVIISEKISPEQWLDKLLDYSGEVRLRLYQGRRYWIIGKIPEARNAFNRALQLDPGNSLATLALKKMESPGSTNIFEIPQKTKQVEILPPVEQEYAALPQKKKARPILPKTPEENIEFVFKPLPDKKPEKQPLISEELREKIQFELKNQTQKQEKSGILVDELPEKIKTEYANVQSKFMGLENRRKRKIVESLTKEKAIYKEEFVTPSEESLFEEIQKEEKELDDDDNNP
ncbi:tetratricopeptide repeat protein, partial [Candidatus Riflebacteria bacterium]